jgi:2-polyprenyl-3-methyl-5-hydroxy-6-metoxy-1,4-benzoquinol methylase
MNIHHWSSEQITRFWDYESQFPDNYWSRQCGSKLIRFFRNELASSHNILDLGCGDGGLFEHLVPWSEKKHNKSIYGFDISESSVLTANKKFHSYDTYKGAYHDLSALSEKLNEENQQIDLIFCCEVVEHVYDADLVKVLETAKQLLATGGKFIITTPNKEDLAQNYICNPLDGSLFHRWQHVRSWSSSTLSSRLIESGFKIVNIFETNILHLNESRIPSPKTFYRKLRYPDLNSLFVVSTR